MSILGTPSPDDLELLRQVMNQVARSARLSQEDAEDFMQTAQLRLIERGYDAFARFGGRSSLRTYLTVVVRRMLLDWRNASQGKWRASAAARRLGPLAIGLERLVHRDGHPPDEAIALLRSRGSLESRETLAALLAQLPVRTRSRALPMDAVDHEPSVRFEDPLDAMERRQVRRQVRDALAAALRQLPPEDRQLIGVRYGGVRSLHSLAKDDGTTPKALYRRVDRLMRQLRRAMASAGVTESHIH